MLPQEDGGVVDNKLKVSLSAYHAVTCTGTRRHLLTQWPVGIRDDKHPGDGHFNYSSSNCGTPTRCAVFIMPFI